MEAVVNEVYKQTGMPVELIGHSLGAEASIDYVSGATLTKDGHSVVFDSKLALERQKGTEELPSKVSKIICFGGGDISSGTADSKLAFKTIGMLTRPIEGGLDEIPLLVGENLGEGQDCITGVKNSVVDYVYNFMPSEIVSMGESQEEVRKLRTQIFSDSLSLDVFKDFDEIMRSENGYITNRYNNVHVPVLFVNGANDFLVPPEMGAGAISKMPNDTPKKQIVIPGAGLTYPITKVPIDLANIISGFTQDPDGFSMPSDLAYSVSGQSSSSRASMICKILFNVVKKGAGIGR